MRHLSKNIDGYYFYWVETDNGFFDSDVFMNQYETLTIPVGLDLKNIGESVIHITGNGYKIKFRSPNIVNIKKIQEYTLRTLINEVLNDK